MNVTNIFSKNDWLRYLEKVERQAPEMDPVASSTRYSSMPPIYNIDRSTHLNFNMARPKTQSEKDQERANFYALVGAMTLIASAALFGFIVKPYLTQKKHLTESSQLLNRVHFAAFQNCGDVRGKIASLVTCKTNVDRTELSRCTKYTISAVGMMVSGAAMALGGFTATPWLMTAGAISCVAIAAFGAFSLAYHWNDDQSKRDNFVKIHGLIDKIRNEVCQFDTIYPAIPVALDPPCFAY